MPFLISLPFLPPFSLQFGNQGVFFLFPSISWKEGSLIALLIIFMVIEESKVQPLLFYWGIAGGGRGQLYACEHSVHRG